MALTQAKTTIAASGSDTFTSTGLDSNLYHTISITGSGTATIQFTHLDNILVNIETGKTAGVYTYIAHGVTSIKLTETGGANSIDYAISSTGG